MNHQKPAGALNSLLTTRPRSDLRGLSLADLTGELVARLADGATYEQDRDLVIAAQLQDTLDTVLDVHLNRFSCRRLYDVARPVLDELSVDWLRGRTVVELGSGSLNPLSLGFLFVALGASRAYSIDLEPMQDESRGVRALSSLAGWLLTDASRVVGAHAPERSAIGRALEGFDFGRLRLGDRGGIDADRLRHRMESISRLSVGDSEADLIVSTSLLEHVEDIEGAMSELRRVTTSGGVGCHVVDFVDHRTYGGGSTDPRAFLTIESRDRLVHGSNRLRCGEICGLFTQYGFEVQRIDRIRVEPVRDEDIARFAEPFRSMHRDDLELLCARLIVRRN